MTSLLTVLDQLSPTAAHHSTTPSTTVTTATHRVRDAARVLRYIDKVEIHGTSLNWASKKCFVVLVSLRDTDARKKAFASGGHRTRSASAAPFQIERTPAEFYQLERAMRQWCATPHNCKFCTPIASGAIVNEAFRIAHDVTDGDEAEEPRVAATCFGFLSSSAAKTTKPPTLQSDDEWEAWLNAIIGHARSSLNVDAVDATGVCDGARHVPALLDQFLLEGFMSVSSP